MREIITIKNLGPIQDVTLELKPFVMLIGESASGKSTILKAVSMMRSIYQHVSTTSYLYLSKITDNGYPLVFDFFLADYGLLEMVNSETYISFKAIFDDCEYELEYTLRALSDYALIVQSKHLTYSKNSFVTERRSYLPDAVNLGNEFDFDEHLYKKMLKDFSDASNVITKLELPYLNMKFMHENQGSEYETYTISPADESYPPVDLENASSGIQTSTPLALITSYLAQNFDFKKDFNRSVLSRLLDADKMMNFKPVTEVKDMLKLVNIHIEEPELSLYPDAQRLLISHLVDIMNTAKEDRKMQLMFATHSPYILNHVAYLLEASYYPNKREERKLPLLQPENVEVYQIVDGKAQSLMATKPDGHVTVNTLALSTTMADIYNETNSLGDD